MKRIVPHCHLARKKDCLDLPEQVDEVRLVEMAPEQARHYKEMKRDLITEIQGESITAQVALTKIMKLRQITSSFLYTETGDFLEITPLPPGASTERDKTVLIKNEFSNPKLKELFNVIEEAGPQPIIIWINFHWEQIKICHELYKKFGEDQVVTLSALTKDKDESIKAFQEGRARFLVAHGRSAAHGLTFVNCSFQIFFSLDWSWETFEQARARIHRAGQMNKCTYVYLLCKDTIDEQIYDVLQRKADAQEILSEYIK
jgi:SNF2 family DNA or RNA helicase